MTQPQLLSLRALGQICDPIRSNQKYNLGSMKLSAGGATPIGLTATIDTADRAISMWFKHKNVI
jgi:hypothetical protein